MSNDVKINTTWECSYTHKGCSLSASSATHKVELRMQAEDGEVMVVQVTEERIREMQNLLNRAIYDLENKKYWNKKATLR